MNYDLLLRQNLKNIDGETLLLHSCYLANYFNITVFYYNPNISEYDEYKKRVSEQIRLIENMHFKYPVKFIEGDYDNDLYEETIKGLENEPERGARCSKCFYLRLSKTAELALKNNFDYFCTTLTVSPYKNSKVINEIGEKLQNKYKVKYLFSDFKKQDGYKKSIELSKKYNLYRQNYCGCKYSKRDKLTIE